MDAKQLAKLVPVVKVRDFKGAAYVERDLCLVTVAAEPGQRSEVIEIVNLFRGRVVHVRGAYLVPDTDLLVESARPGGHDLMALPRQGKQLPDAFAKKR